MRHYDIIAFGTGTALNVVSEALLENPSLKVAVVENGQ